MGKKLATYTTTFTGSYPLYKMQLNCQSNNVYFGGRLVSAEGNSVRTDRLDSVRSGGPGGLGYQAQYPYGVEYTTTANDREKYATYTRDSLTGFDYAVNRYYSSQWGRFLSPDPQSRSVDPGNPQTWNRYSYVENDPTNISDPTGLWPGKYCWWDYGGESIGDFETCFELDVPQSGPTGGSGSGPNPCDKITDSVGLQGLSYAKASQIWSDGNLATYSSPSSAATVAALATITWLGESNFGLTPVNNGNYSASGTLTSVDYGPFQINQHFQPNTNGAVWGTNGAGQVFNGNPDANITFGIQILEGLYSSYGNNAAGRYVGSLGNVRTPTGFRPVNPNAQNREAAWTKWKNRLTALFSDKDCFYHKP